MHRISNRFALNIVYLTSEAIPFARTGGLGDVCGSLPNRVSKLGHQVSIIMPAFRCVHSSGLSIVPTDISFTIEIKSATSVSCRLLKGKLPGGDVTVWFIDQPKYFDREGLYGDGSVDYPDNAERFAFFCRASIKAMERLQMSPDVVHCNDWQTGLVPAILKLDATIGSQFSSTTTLMTIHNLAYQGNFSAEAFDFVGLGWEHFTLETFEFYRRLNFLKAGITCADTVTTVSPQYAQEITTQTHGCGLDGVLRAKSDHLHGIINGIDNEIWNPATDHLIPHQYDLTNWRVGKLANKQHLQLRFGLEANDELPLIGLVGRLADQKGWDLILPVIKKHLVEHRPTQWIVLGSGNPQLETELRSLAAQHPSRLAVYVGFNDEHAHLIEAASDLFLMPSHYEPCGLSQLYSLRYGSVPVVNPTGGLADTVVDTQEDSLEQGTATGFYLEQADSSSLDRAIGRALSIRYHQPENWSRIVTNGMLQNWSWNRSADNYIKCYERSLVHKFADRS